MRILHFDVGSSQSKYARKKGHEYFDCTLNQYLQECSEVTAEIVTAFPTSVFDRETIDSIKNLKLIITRSIGVDNIDVRYCEEKGIEYKNIEYSRHNIAHHTIGLILYHARQFKESEKQIQKGTFCHDKVNCVDLTVRTLGIIGYGRIGKEVAKLADTFGMRVIVYDHKYREGDMIDGFFIHSLDELLRESDIISLHCNLNENNRHMINRETISKMKEGVVLINTARGPLINEQDLLKKINKFSFVGLDVLCNEANFNQNHPLVKNPKIFITPHTAYKSEVTTKERWEKTYACIKEFIS